ncbi:MAG: hypothetical protein IJ418_03305 [Clostridia bacterium]|nr:hypothetical protein [Clostridia bacterium]
MKYDNLELRAAFPAMPESCRSALMDAARSVKEEAPVKRKIPAAILIAALLMLTMTIAIAAQGWDVLTFLGLRQDSGASQLVEPVSAQASAGSCSIRIDSAITDGQYLAFDWTFENNNPDQHIYVQVDSFTANGETVFTDGTDDFHCCWFPGMFNDGLMQNGNLTLLPETLAGDTLHVEMTIGLYAPKKPVYMMDAFDEDLARQKLGEGYYVIPQGDGFLIDDPEEGLLWAGGRLNSAAAVDFTHTEMTVSFDLDLTAGRAASRSLTRPTAITIQDNAVLECTSALITPLQLHMTAAITPAEATYETVCSWFERGHFALTNASGSTLDIDHALLISENGVTEQADGAWLLYADMTILDPASLPDQVSLSFILTDGTVYVAPITIR